MLLLLLLHSIVTTVVHSSVPPPTLAKNVATTVPTVEIAPGVHLPFITMGGVNKTLYPNYPDYSNYSLWLQLGGTGIDSAWEYRTQAGIAQAMVSSNLKRSDLFLTTKIPGSLHNGCCGCPGAAPPGQCLVKCHGVCFPASGHYTAKQATDYIKRDLKILFQNGVDYIDLLLLHQPCDFLAPYPYNATSETSMIYGALEDALLSQDPLLKGKIKAIGVSNFDATQLALLATTNKRVTPAVNQCRMSIGEYDVSTHQYCQQHNITYQAYSTLHGDVKNSAVSTIAANHHVSAEDVVMRWVTQLGVPLVTASDSMQYDVSDIGIFDFELTSDEMHTLSALKR